jgi:sialic acid synthase SpsE
MIIAEIGQNWCGNSELVIRLINLAQTNGADLVKFQLYDSEKLYGEYQDTELNFNQAKWLFDYGARNGIEVFFSVFDVERVRWCEEIGVKRYKIAYSQQNNTSVLEAIGATYKKTIISTDKDTYASEFKPYIHDFRNAVGLLYCVPNYPAQVEFDGIEFGEEISGFSDHTIGLTASKIAIARGAEIIEKHFALDHKTGIDAEWSMTPSELRELKDWENTVEQLL